MKDNKIVTEINLWNLPEEKIYVKIVDKCRIEFFDYILRISKTVNNLLVLTNRKTLTFGKYKNGEISIPLKLIKNILGLCSKHERIKFMYEIQNSIKEIKYGCQGKSIINPNFPINFSCIFAHIAGHLVGDGGISNRGLGISTYYTNQCNSLVECFKTNLSEVFSNVEFRIFHDKRDNTKTIHLPSIVGLILMQFLGLQVGDTKQVPKLIINSNKLIKSTFLRALFDDEGSVNVNNHLIRLGISNESVIEVTKNMLKEFGILPTKTIKINGKNGWRDRYDFCIVSRGDLEIFNKKIGFDHPEKKKKLEFLLKSYKSFQSRKGNLEKL